MKIMRCVSVGTVFATAVLCLALVASGQQSPLPYERMAARIAQALQVEKDERVILRFDPKVMPQLEAETRRQFEAAGAVVESWPYGPMKDFEKRLQEAAVYVWLPTETATPPEQAAALARWLDAGRGRQVHFHWGDGTRGEDGNAGKHSDAYDRVYLEALDADPIELDRQMDAAIEKLRAGEIRVTTPAGTDLRFRVGERPFVKQTGDASRERMKAARVRVDREIELPAGALRVAPVETTVEGTLVIPKAKLGGENIRDIRLVFRGGTVMQATARRNADGLRLLLKQNAGLNHFREFALGFNPKLVAPRGKEWIPYYGYGAGVVRLSLGDNTELGGDIHDGRAVQWFFFTDATVRAGDTVLVDSGRLQ